MPRSKKIICISWFIKTKKTKDQRVRQQILLSTHICDDRQYGHPVENFLPGPNAVGLGCHGASELSGELPGVNSDFNDVVEKSQKRCQGEGSHKKCDETELDHCERGKVLVRDRTVQQHHLQDLCHIFKPLINILKICIFLN